MSLVNQVPKIVPEDFETMLNSNINVSAIPGLLGACAFPHLSRTPVEGVGKGDLEEIEESRLGGRAQVLGDAPPAVSLLPVARVYQWR